MYVILKFFSSTSSMKGRFFKIKKSDGVQTANKYLNKLPFLSTTKYTKVGTVTPIRLIYFVEIFNFGPGWR
jgi:hypothetical protein